MEKICEGKAICVFRGEGVVTLTDSVLAWNKTAASYLLYGVMVTLTDNVVSIPLSDIALVEKYMFIGGGGLKVTLASGEVVKFSIKSKKSFNTIYGYIRNRMAEQVRLSDS